eukprot:1093387_1
MTTSCAVDWDASQSQIFMILCLSLNYHIQAMTMLINTVNGQPIQYYKETIQQSGCCIERIDTETNEKQGRHLCGLNVLSNIFTNIKRWRIDLSGVDADAQNNVIFNDKLIQFVAKKQVQSVRFLNVLESTVTDSVAAYKETLAAVGWE